MTVIVENVGNEEFSKVLFCLVKQYNNTYDAIRSRLKESAHTMLRNWCKLQRCFKSGETRMVYKRKFLMKENLISLNKLNY